MAIRASTQQGPPAVGGGCQSPVNNSQLLVTKAATAVFSYGPSTTAGQGYSYFPIDKNIRCTHEGVLKTLSLAKKEVNEFFDNVIVNDQEEIIKKNRLELLKMLCKSFDNYFNFSKIEA